MIIKKKDSRQSDIIELTLLLSLPLSPQKKFLIERELNFLKSGERGENDSAYFIDFEFAESKNWAVIHDLRLENRNRVAQIDHLLINRLFDIYILETKNFTYGVKISDKGEFLVNHNNNYFSIESPIEQNKRHKLVLESVIKQFDIMPTRLAISIVPTYKSFIMVSTKSRVTRPAKKQFDTSMVIKADTLRTTIDKEFDSRGHISVLLSGTKLSSTESLREVAVCIAARHKPSKIDYRKKFGINDDEPVKRELRVVVKAEKAMHYYCNKCKKTITQKVASFCWDNKKRFGGRAYCFDCQKTVEAK